MVTADEFGRSLRGVSALVQRRAEGLLSFDMSLDGFRRSFGAVGLTLPAYVVTLALARQEAGLPFFGWLDAPALALIMAFGQVASFLALPLAMIPLARRFGWGGVYVPFVIVANWFWVFGALALAVPGILHLTGIETTSLCRLFTLAFAVLVFEAGRFATRAILRVGNPAAIGIVSLGFALNGAVGWLVALAQG